MRIEISKILVITTLFFAFVGYSQEIPIEYLNMNVKSKKQYYEKTLLKNEIQGIDVKQISVTSIALKENLSKGNKYIYLFVKGTGKVKAKKESYELVPETILLPNAIQKITIIPSKNDTLHFLKIASKLTEQDIADLKAFPLENTQNIYYKKFTDCESYTEPIKSPNTISRTILPSKYIPRIAMGTVQTKGPDVVGAHEHGMLEQLFLGLTDNEVTVFADEAQIKFPEYSLLHIPLGSSHSVKVEKDKILYYVWMDFFRNKEGEEWLKTHNTITKEE